MHALLVAALLSTVAPDAGPAVERRLVVSTGLRLRAAPSPDAAIVDKVPIGTVLPCRERSAPVEVGGTKGAFCRAPTGWFFAPLTQEVKGDLTAQVQRLVDERAQQYGVADEASKADAYEFHRFLLRRVDDATTRESRLQARFDELAFVRVRAEAFSADRRIDAGALQGPRMKNDAIWALVDDAKGSPIAERAAWIAVEHGVDFECEGYKPCYVALLKDIECAYLGRFPQGARAAEALRRIHETVADALAKPDEHQPMERDDWKSLAGTLEGVRRCVAAAGAKTSRIDAAIAAARAKL